MALVACSDLLGHFELPPPGKVEQGEFVVLRVFSIVHVSVLAIVCFGGRISYLESGFVNLEAGRLGRASHHLGRGSR